MPTESDPSAQADDAADKALNDKIQRVVSDYVGRAMKKGEAAQAARFDELKTLIQGFAPPQQQAAQQQGLVDPAAADGNPAADGKLTLRALQEQVAALRKESDTKLAEERKVWQSKFEQQEQKAREADERALDIQMRSEVRAAYARALGADSPHLDALMDSHYDVRKRFGRTDDGKVGVKFKRDWGEEVVPLDKAMEDMAKGELKPFLPARAGSLPPSSITPLRGAVNGGHRAPSGEATSPPGQPWLDEVADSVKKRHPIAAANLAAAADAPAPTPKK